MKRLTESIYLQGGFDIIEDVTLTQGAEPPFGGLQIITPICKPPLISFIVSPKRRPIKVDQQKSRIHVASIERCPTREG
jgi:hypothetical protein